MAAFASSSYTTERTSTARRLRSNARLYVPEDMIRVLGAVAEAPRMAVLVDVDSLQRNALTKVDRVMLLALDALSRVNVQVVLLSRLGGERTALLHRGVFRSWWCDQQRGWQEEGGASDTLRGAPIELARMVEHLHERIPGVQLIAVSDDPELLGTLTHVDRGIALGGTLDSPPSTIATSGDVAVRAAIWWLVDTRWKAGMVTLS